MGQVLENHLKIYVFVSAFRLPVKRFWNQDPPLIGLPPEQDRADLVKRQACPEGFAGTGAHHAADDKKVQEAVKIQIKAKPLIKQAQKAGFKTPERPCLQTPSHSAYTQGLNSYRGEEARDFPEKAMSLGLMMPEPLRTAIMAPVLSFSPVLTQAAPILAPVRV